MFLDVNILGSSSKGNCYIIKAGGEELIIECGTSITSIKKALNYNFNAVAGCLVSHEHKDHCKSVHEIVKLGVDIYTSKGTAEACGLSGHRVNIVKAETQFKAGGFTVMPLEVQHDASEPLGFLIRHKEFGKLLFATDTYYLKYKFKGLNYIMVECNYSEVIAEKNSAEGVIHPLVLSRLYKSHFSLENLVAFFKANDLSALQHIFLLHLSSKNSDPKLFKNTIQQTTGIPVTIC